MKPYRYRTREETKSPSKRWQTTASSALAEVAGKLEGSYDRAGMIKDLKQRKQSNTTTSISFGNEKVNYVSDTKDNQRKSGAGMSVDERSRQTARIKQMKADLTATKFKLGDEKTVYKSSNQTAMDAAETFKGVERVAMNTELKNAIKKSSIHFGNEKVQYGTTAHEAMRYNGNENNFAQLKDEVKEMTATLRKHNFSFGDERVEYESDYHAGYGSVPIEAYMGRRNNKASMKDIIEDSRSCHFSLGNDKPNYLSNTHSALQNVEGQTTNDISKGLEQARAMKAALQKTSIVIGDDDEYY